MQRINRKKNARVTKRGYVATENSFTKNIATLKILDDFLFEVPSFMKEECSIGEIQFSTSK